MKNPLKNWQLKEFLLLLLEIVFFFVGTCFVFPLLGILGVVYSFVKHLFFKWNYSVSKQLTPIIRSINLSADGLANAGAGELLNDVLGVKDDDEIRYGDAYQSISGVTGLRKVYAKKDTWLRKALKILGKNHCEDSIKLIEHFYYQHKNNH